MRILDVSTERTNDDKQFDKNGKNWFIKIKFDNKKQFGIEIKPEMTLSELVFELVKFTNLILTKAND